MDIRPIKTENGYEAALQKIACLMDAKLDTPEGDRLDILVTLVEAYERCKTDISPSIAPL
jgi:HTH-type transcriptional regulator/antitoxin HigA